jgi:hypothetical protein
VLVLVFLALVCFTLEFTPTQLVDSHSLTPKSTKDSLCTCLCQKMVYYLFMQTIPSLKFFLETLSQKSSLNSLLLNLLVIWVDDLSFHLDLVLFFLVNHVVALSSEYLDPLMILPRYLVICYNPFSSIGC